MKLTSGVFYTNKYDEVLDFYTNIVGLEIDRKVDDKFVSFIFPSGGKLAIKVAIEKRELPGSQAIFIEVEDINSPYSIFIEKKVSFLKELTKEVWGTEFSVLDPDGNKIVFTSQSSPSR